MNYALHILTLVAIFGVLSGSLNLVAGYTGFVSIAQAAVFGIGAYASAVLSLRLDCPFLVSSLLAMAGAATAGFALALPSFHIRGDVFVILTFAFQFAVAGVFNNWVAMTRGSVGLYGIPPAAIGPWVLTSRQDYAILAVCVLGATQWMIWRIVQSPFGRVLMSIRGDEMLT